MQLNYSYYGLLSFLKIIYFKIFMKKLVLYIFLLTIISNVLSQTTQKPKEFSRWSITPEYGYCVFDGDIKQKMNDIFPTSIRNANYGMTLEYAFTPIWGISLDYFYFPLHAFNTSPIGLDINTVLQTTSVNATINFTRWIFPETKSKFYVSGSLGLGFSYYTFNVLYLQTITSTGITSGKALQDNEGYYVSGGLLTDASGNFIPGDPVGVKDQIYNVKRTNTPEYIRVPGNYGIAVTIPVTFSFEYNMSKPLAIGARIHYRAHTKDNLEGVQYLNFDGVTNDVIEAVTLYARFKFNVFKKDHIRLIPNSVFDPDKGLIAANELAKKVDKLIKRVDILNARVDSLVPRVTRLENMMANDGPDSDGDGVPDVRDLAPNTPPNTPVDFWGRPLAVQAVTAAAPIPKNATNIVASDVSKSRISWDDIPAVYFDFDKIDLDNEALETISKIAFKMKSDQTLNVEVRGYCDYIGNNPYNNHLSQRRSDRVKAELVKIWGISATRIIANGKGKNLEPKIRYRPNRRCDFFFGKL